MGLGSTTDFSLAEAREKAFEARKVLRTGKDPIEMRLSAQRAAASEDAKRLTFDTCVQKYVEDQGLVWRNEKHRRQWTSTLQTYASPVFGMLPVSRIDTALVMKVLQPIWQSKTETASRLRGRIERVLDWARTHDYRHGENPARWRGHLEILLPKRTRVRSVAHHPALPYERIAEFIHLLRGVSGIASVALEFTILTAARTSETIGATWPEIDLLRGVWTIPAGRMKAGKEHKVPLSRRCCTILEVQFSSRLTDSSPVFPGLKDKPLSNMALSSVLRRLDRKDITVHGFRSSFRDWAADLTNYANEVVELALAHAISNKVEAAYRRGIMFEKRLALMEEWGSYCEGTSAAVAEVLQFAARRI